ncbi:MAG TPA: YicC/YloC family endoribonuclease [Spirochaetia bacterium]|nr:YicC/YloC family endoribonuclease [Spirochaetia bacterium]
MTGFGYSEVQNAELYSVLDMKSYNNRYLDIQVNLPPNLNALEPRVREYLACRINRGRVEIFIRIVELMEAIDVQVDGEVARSYASSLKKIIAETGIDDQVRLSHLIRLEGVLKVIKKRDIELYWKYLEPHLDKTFRDFEQYRTQEGRKIKEDIERQLILIEEGIRGIEDKKEELKQVLSNNLRERFQELLGDAIDEHRIYSETALMLVKFDINEELVRMKALLENFRSVMNEQTGVGKKLDFISQEFNREINTIGSKSIQVDIHSSVIKVKDSVERIREQLRNVE